MDIKSVIAVLGGMVIMFFLAEILEPPLVIFLAGERPATLEAFQKAAYEPQVLWGRLGITALTGLLAGYVVGKIAGAHEMAHAGISAALRGAVVLSAFASDPNAAGVPLAMRAGFVAVTVGTMVAGASVRARAARLQSNEVRS